jgi:hypothetical protein
MPEFFEHFAYSPNSLKASKEFILRPIRHIVLQLEIVNNIKIRATRSRFHLTFTNFYSVNTLMFL